MKDEKSITRKHFRCYKMELFLRTFSFITKFLFLHTYFYFTYYDLVNIEIFEMNSKKGKGNTPTIDSYFNKVPASKRPHNDSVTSPSNSPDSAIINSPLNHPAEEQTDPVTYEFNFANVLKIKHLTAETKQKFYMDYWKPSQDFDFKSVFIQKQSARNFYLNQGILNDFPWMAASPSHKGVYCRLFSLFLFLNSI